MVRKKPSKTRKKPSQPSQRPRVVFPLQTPTMSLPTPAVPKQCNYCGFVNMFPRVPNPVRCPRCNNPYNRAPRRNKK